ncbi:MAG: DNRLRE domain-containing protein [Clostridia bacterium]|nr:DNRLRE domain-containing protein [Clostridia bacterium]
MRKLTKIISIILGIVICVNIIVPGTMVAEALPLVGNNVAKSAAEGITLPSQGNASEMAENDTMVSVNDASDENSDSKIITPIMSEVEELRTENTKHYRHKDGTYTAAIYPEPIHYMDSTGSWQDIDNTLTLNSSRKSVSGKATYTPKSSSLDIRIPQDFSGGQFLTIGKDGYVVGMRLKTSDTISMSATAEKIDLSSTKAEIDNNYGSTETSSVDVLTSNSSSKLTIEEANKEEMKLENKVSAVNYKNIFDGADLQYVITPSKVKENIIVNEKQDSYVYKFELDLNGLIPVQQDNGSIKLYENIEDDEAVFVIETPYMYDANEDTSFDVSMNLSGNILTVTANSEWINDENRAFPVTIDPTISANPSVFYDATANKNTPTMNFDSYKFLYAGNGLLNLRRTYFKFSIPSLPDGSVVINATLEIKQHDVDLGDETVKLIAFDLTESASWTESSITWNNQPLSKDKNGPRDNPDLKKLDYELFKVEDDKGQIYSFNLTKAVKNWYEGATNNGIMITSSDEEKNSQTTLYSSDHNDTSLHPAVKIEYTNNIGLEDYWTYETTDLGRSGSLHANPYNGAVTYVHSDLSMTGNLMPISISHIHNHNTDNIYTSVYSGMYVGRKYHLNIQEVLIYDQQIGKYKHYDADGTLHYYYSNDNNSPITHEYDPTKVLTSTSSGYVITDSQDNKKYFNSNGQLYKCVDNNGNELTITITNNKITSVTDAVGRVVTLTYNSYNQLESITDPAGRTITYSYSNTGTYATLSKITYSDGKYTSFSYSSYNITRINVYDGSYTLLSYNYKTYRGKRVEKIKNYDKNSQFVNMLTFKFTEDNISGIASGNTLVSNYLAETEDENNKKSAKIYLFDPYGRAISVTNSAGQTQYEIYGENANTADFNKLKDSSELLTIATNLLKNHGFERGNTYWSALQTAVNGSWGIIYDYEKSSRGYYCLKLELPDTTGVYEIDQDFAAKEGQTYTVSVDINIPEVLSLTGNNGVAVGFTYCVDGVWKTEASKWIGETNGWERFSHTFTLPTGTISNCHLFLKLAQAKGTAYFDNVQVEESGGARSYNLVENSDFSNVTNSNGVPAAASAYAWTKYNCQATDGVYFRDWGNRNFFEITGSTEHKKYIYQNVPVNAKAGDTIIIGGKAAAYASGGTSNGRSFEISSNLYDSDGYYIDTVEIEFDRTINQERQIRATCITLDKDCRNLYLYFNFYNQTGPLSIDNLFVYVDNFGEHYDYNSKGQITELDNDEGTTTNYEYSSNNVDVSKVTQTVSGVEQTVAEYSYDNSHNVTNVTNNIGTEIKCEYNDAGQLTKQTTVVTDENDKKTKMVESFTYYQNGNYLKSYTDVSGLTTSYVYDNNMNGENITKGLLTSIRNADGYTTSYIYDPNTDEVLSTTGATATPVSSTTNFTYENYLPKTITRNGTTYAYEYDSQNRVTSSKVGNQILITNSYDDRDRLSQVTYANGGAYASVYDSRDRLVGDYWNGTQISEYNYNENDRLSKFVDNITDVSYQYEYAFYDLPFKVTGTDGTKTSCDYDMSGTLARLTFSDGDDIIYSGKYFTNEKGMPEDVVIDTLDNATMHYNYDDFGRVKSYSYGPVIRTFRYEDPIVNGGVIATDKVIEIIDKTKDGVVLQSYELESFFDGSLYYVSENVEGDYYDYFYDGLRRVIENYANGDVYDYYYDAGGNLLEVTCNTLPFHTYTYGTANWKDQLTAFDGKAITYDANGNPVAYDGYTYTWQRGTQLANITGNGKNISYVYDSQGHRVQKTVNGVTTNYLYSGDLLMRQTDGTNTIDFQYDAGGNLVGFLYNGVPYYYLRNVLNDISGVVDGDGNVVAKYRYDAYGNTILATGTMAEINPIRYRGYYYDTETNWYYLESRYYNPEWCRFISPDSLFVAGDAITGSNMYAYCNDNPILYVDPTGTAAEESFWGNVIGNAIWASAKIKSYVYLPVSWAAGALSHSALVTVKSNEKLNVESVAEIPTVANALPIVKEKIADKAMPRVFAWAQEKFPVTTSTFNVPTGLRHFMPINMEFGAEWASYLLGFKYCEYGKYVNYTSSTDTPMWQSVVGYSPVYDFFFSVGGPIFKDKYPFIGNDNKYYIIWIWKADYWNLGAGAEIGIYSTDNPNNVAQEFYEVDTNLRLHVDMTVKYKTLGLFEKTLNHFEQENWWVCSFTPKIQFPNINWLSVELKVKFNDDSLMTPFYDKWKKFDTSSDVNDDWDEVEMAPTPYISKETGHTTHKCNSEHPTECSCSYTCCSKPCRYYSDNGYQFYINY